MNETDLYFVLFYVGIVMVGLWTIVFLITPIIAIYHKQYGYAYQVLLRVVNNRQLSSRLHTLPDLVLIASWAQKLPELKLLLDNQRAHTEYDGGGRALAALMAAGHAQDWELAMQKLEHIVQSNKAYLGREYSADEKRSVDEFFHAVQARDEALLDNVYVRTYVRQELLFPTAKTARDYKILLGLTVSIVIYASAQTVHFALRVL